MSQAARSTNHPDGVGDQMVDRPEPNYGIARHIVFAIIMIFALVAGCGGWAATSELAGAVISQGSVVVERHVKKVQHREGGIVAEIAVRNGDVVKSGDTLLRLDETTTRAELGVIQSQLMELRVRLARLAAERDLADTIEFPKQTLSHPAAESVLAGEIKLFRSNRDGRDSQKAQLRLRIEQLHEEINGIDVQRDAKRRELELFKKELAGARQLLDQKLMPATRVYALEREEARISGEHGNLIAQAARIRGQVSEILLQIIGVDLTVKTEAQRELRAIEARIAEIAEREVAALDRLSRTRITAPQDGVVHELAVHTVGGVITPAEALMLIVPQGDALSIELRIPPISIEQVHLEQPVRLRFTAFNQRVTPELKGRISYISADVSQDSKSRMDYFSARVELLEASDWKISGKRILPGMPVEAYITTDSRTAISYLVKPFIDQFSRAFREQ